MAAAAIGFPPETSAPDPKLTEMVRRLGDKSYKVRAAAARDLLMSGPPAFAALTAGAKDADPEVAGRCRQLLPAAAAAERNEKLARFLKDPAAPPPKSLAGAERFLKITGDDKASRQLYAEMLGAHHAIIEGLETDPKAASRLMNNFVNEVYVRWEREERNEGRAYDTLLADRGQAALILFVRADGRFVDAPELAGHVATLLQATKLRAALAGPGRDPGVTRLFLHWLQAEKHAYVASQAFELAAAANMREISPVALTIVADSRWEGASRAQALMIVLKLGGKEHLTDAAKLLEDKTGIGSIKFDNDPALESQLRDVALGVSVMLAGKKPADFGFDSVRFGNGAPDSFHYFGFPDDASREKAHAKWKALVKSQEKPSKK